MDILAIDFSANATPSKERLVVIANESTGELEKVTIDELSRRINTLMSDSFEWAQSGSVNITSVSRPSITALSSTRIAFIDGTLEQLRAYDFDGSSWSQVGSSLSIPSILNPKIAALSSTRIAFIDRTNGDLRTYDFDGTDWSQVGSPRGIGLATHPHIAALSGNRVALSTTLTIRTYDFNDSSWVKISDQSLTGSDPCVSAIGGDAIAYIIGTGDLRVYNLSKTLPPSPVFT